MAKGLTKRVAFSTPKGTKMRNVRGSTRSIVNHAPANATAINVIAPVRRKVEVDERYSRLLPAPQGQVCMRGPSGRPVCVSADAKRTGSKAAKPKKAKGQRMPRPTKAQLARMARQVQRGFDPGAIFGGLSSITIR